LLESLQLGECRVEASSSFVGTAGFFVGTASFFVGTASFFVGTASFFAGTMFSSLGSGVRSGGILTRHGQQSTLCVEPAQPFGRDGVQCTASFAEQYS
jgi:hypothetical protein